MRTFTAAAIVSTLLLACACQRASGDGDQGGDETRPNRVVLVHIAPASRKPIRAMLQTAGGLSPRLGSEARVSAQVEGSVGRIIVDVGQAVKAGEAVMQIDPLALDADERKAQADVGMAAATADLARQKLERQKLLKERGIVSGRDVAEAEAELAQATQALANARAGHDIASTRAGRAIVKSPVAGTILEREVALGQFVQPETMLFAVAPIDALELVCALPPGAIEQIKPGLDAEVEVPGSKALLPGKVTLVSPALDAATGAATVRIQIANEGTLRPGTLCHAGIVLERHETALVIPAASVRYPEGEGKPTVAVVDDKSVAHAREVVIAIREGENVEIADGLKDGEKVVTDGSYGLPDGTKVKDLASAPAPADADGKDDKGDKG